MFAMKLLFIFGIVVILTVNAQENIVGGISQLQGSDLESAKTELKNSLAKLASGEGPKYKLKKLVTASRQVVAGNLYRIHAELEDENQATKVCNVAIWSRPWLENGIEVTFECDGQPKVIKNHSA